MESHLIPCEAGSEHCFKLVSRNLRWVVKDDLLSQRIEEGSGIADSTGDLAFVIEAPKRFAIHLMVAFDQIYIWLRMSSLKFALQKTVVTKRLRRSDRLGLDFLDTRLTPVMSLKYLGIHLECQGLFGIHKTR